MEKRFEIKYEVYSRQYEGWVTNSYRLPELMNKLEDVAYGCGGRIKVVSHGLNKEGDEVLTVDAVNAFGAAVSENLRQPPANIERAILNCLRNVRKPMVSERDGQDVLVGMVDDGVRV